VKTFAFGFVLAAMVEAAFLLLLVDFSSLKYQENDVMAIIAVGLVMGTMVGAVLWAFDRELSR